MQWAVPRLWKNQDVWILGGGPSLTSNFNIPENIVSKVRAQELPLSSYSPFMSAVHEKNIIGVNVSFMLGNWVDMCFFGDTSFLLKYEEALLRSTSLKVSCAEKAKDLGWVKFLPVDYRTRGRLTFDNSKISWNFNSGSASINLAAHLGAKRIILVGFDMNMPANQVHWHNEYKKTELTEEEKILRNKNFNSFLEPFPKIKKDLDSCGIEIYNTSLNSAITCIQKVPITEFL